MCNVNISDGTDISGNLEDSTSALVPGTTLNANGH